MDNYKNVYMCSHGSRIRDSFFRLEPNVRVHMNCSDTLTYIGTIAHLLIIKKNISKKHDPIEHVKLQKTFNRIYQIYEGDNIKTERLLKEIRKKIAEQKEALYSVLSRRKERLDKEIKKISKLINKYKKKEENNKIEKKEKVTKELNKRMKKYTFILKMIDNYLKGNVIYHRSIKRLKIINKNYYENINKYERLYKKYKKSKKYMDNSFTHLFGFKKGKYRDNIYLNEFNMCVFSGNLNNNIRKYSSMRRLLDLNICPNIVFSPENNNRFRDYISELPLNIEIKENDNVLVTSEEINIMINKFIQRILNYKAMNKIYLKTGNRLNFIDDTTKNIYKNRNVVILYKNIMKAYNLASINENNELNTKMNNISNEISENNKILYEKNKLLEETNKDLDIMSGELDQINKGLNKKNEKSYKSDELLNNTEYSFGQENINNLKKSIEECKKYIENLNNNIKNLNDNIENLNKEKNKIEIEIKKIEEMEKDLLNKNLNIYVDPSENKLFYPLHQWTDCNIKDTLSNVVNRYMGEYIYNYNRNISDEKILFRYYDVRKRKYMNVNECLEKQEHEYKKYKKYNNPYIILRDLLIYLYDYYGLNNNPNMKLDIVLSNCIGEFSKQERIYRSTALRVDEYYSKIYNINGKKMSLRMYDNNVGKIDDVKRVRRSCFLYKVKDGCPSYCDKPANKNRRTCVVKGRKKKVKKEKFLELGTESISNGSFDKKNILL